MNEQIDEKETSDCSRKDFKSMGKNFVVDGPTRGLTDLPTNQSTKDYHKESRSMD